jgi:hypothetical protein
VLQPVTVIAGALFSRSVPLLSYAAPTLTILTGCVTSPNGLDIESCPRGGGVYVVCGARSFDLYVCCLL